MPNLGRSILSLLTARFSRLRYPALTAIAAALFVADLVVPDFIPFIDEILLGLLTAALASWKSTRPARHDGVQSEPSETAPPGRR